MICYQVWETNDLLDNQLHRDPGDGDTGRPGHAPRLGYILTFVTISSSLILDCWLRSGRRDDVLGADHPPHALHVLRWARRGQLPLGLHG